jgi:hypothetical protein
VAVAAAAVAVAAEAAAAAVVIAVAVVRSCSSISSYRDVQTAGTTSLLYFVVSFFMHRILDANY